MDVISTGIPALDQLTGIGGYPCGRITEVAASKATLSKIRLWIPLVVTGEAPLKGFDLVGVRTPEDRLVTTFMLPRIAEAAREHGTAVVFLTDWEQDVAKALKFHASMRIRIEAGIAKMVKISLSAKQGHSADITQWLA